MLASAPTSLPAHPPLLSLPHSAAAPAPTTTILTTILTTIDNHHQPPLIEDKRAMFEGVPEWLIVTWCSEHDDGSKLSLEDHAAAACATQNFMLSLAADGIGSKWMTGALGAAPEDVLAAVGAKDGEKLLGAIWYGFPAKALSPDNKSPPRKMGLAGTRTDLP